MNNIQFTGTNFQAPVLTGNYSVTCGNQPLNMGLPPTYFPPFPTAEQMQALCQVGNLVGLGRYDRGPDMELIRCRTHELANLIFLDRLPRHPFSAESLARIASYLTIQHAGFIGQPTLEREAKFIIPKEPLLGISLEEFIPYFRILFENQSKLNFAEPLTLGLFLLLFHYIISYGLYVFWGWAGLVPAIINQTYFEDESHDYC